MKRKKLILTAFEKIKSCKYKHLEMQEVLPGNLEGGSCTVPTGLLPLGRLSAEEHSNTKLTNHNTLIYPVNRQIVCSRKKTKDLIFTLNKRALRLIAVVG